MWSGRFSSPVCAPVQSFTASVGFDRAMCHCDAAVLAAHCRSLYLRRVMSIADLADVERGLSEVAMGARAGAISWRPELEDVHRNVEHVLTELVGKAGRMAHTGKSRNDQVSTTARVWLRHMAGAAICRVEELERALAARSRACLNTMMPGLTHMQVAQPVTAAHYLTAYRCMLSRDRSRLVRCTRGACVLTLGSGALAGTNHGGDRYTTADMLGLHCVSPNSLDAVSDRDFVMEYALCCAVLMVHMSRLAEDMIAWSSSIVGFAVLGDALCTGSSIMPQKKNPDILELVRAKAAVLIGGAMGIMAVMKAQGLAYNRDNQEDKAVLLGASRAVTRSLSVMALAVRSLRLNKSRLRRRLESSFAIATDLADSLVWHGMTFRDSHEAVARAVGVAIRAGHAGLRALPLCSRGVVPPLLAARLARIAQPDARVSAFRKDSTGSTSPKWSFRAMRRA
uniref:Argininosuccinate lyase n=1 Tax=Tremblaya princeps TaxID=189385 RepID=ARLY_TREPR|nr:RecName: Full=Argininosuccinate lyase; Short=ASAL; AltName: Full=Arginosuccinase [Candidatus Tremblaya princeps]AAM75989.1 arginosuccinate lyase [Candidatus Tremblaya princeps]